MQYTPALGVCSKCGQSKIQVEGNVKCVLCDTEKSAGSGLTVKTQDPGAELIDKLLAKAGVVSIPGGKPPEPIKPNFEAKQVVTAPRTEAQFDVHFEQPIAEAVRLLKNAPMPKDIKQFKAINKAIKTLESILGA